MDNLTHSLVGVLIARTGLGRLAPYGTALAVVSANLPDADIVSGARGAVCYLANHRGFTHALFWLPLLALAPLPFWWLLARRRGPLTRAVWARAYLISLIAVVTHPLLDALNVYGIRILHPFSEQWLHADLVNIIDVWIWVLLLICVLGPMLANLVYTEIGARGATGRGMAWAGLLLLCAFIGLRAHLHSRAFETLNARLYENEPPRQVLALPSAANPWRWTGLIETETAWRVIPVDLLHEFDPEGGRRFYKPDVAALLSPVAATETGRVFLDFSQTPLWQIAPVSSPEGTKRVTISDLRFGLPGEGAFTAFFVISPEGRVLRDGFAFGTMRPGRP